MRKGELNGERNFGGGSRLILVDHKGVIPFKPDLFRGTKVSSIISLYPGYAGIEFRYTPSTLHFEEKPKKIGGTTIYATEVSGFIPKDRPELLEEFFKLDKKRFVGFYLDNNGKVRIIGTVENPATFSLVKTDHKEVLTDRNEYSISLSIERSFPAFHYSNVSALPTGSGIGWMTIGSTFIVY